MFGTVFQRFLSIRRIPLKVVVITALASWALQLYAVVEGQPLWVIVLYTLVPWIPLVIFEGLWKFEHYHWIAVFAVVTALQVGHMGEHTVQVVQLGVMDGTLACPPPDNATRIVMPDATGQPAVGPNGGQIVGPAACGVLGFLDFETIHLIWDTLVWLGALWLLTKFPRNVFLWLAMIFASLHEVEHLFLGYIFFLDTGTPFSYPKQLWETTVQGKIITATPVGMEIAPANFYDAGGKAGILARNGLVETLLFGAEGRFLPRPYLHFGYNLLVVIPTVLGFIWQARKVYDQHLAKALPSLSEDELIRTTPKLHRELYEPGQEIVRQGDPADRFYIITKGQVDVIRTQGGQEIPVTRLGVGQYFGEIGLLHGGKRTATVRAADDVEVMALDRETFGGLMEDSELSKGEVERLVRQRVGQLQTLKGG